MHHIMFEHAENCILAITAIVTSKLNSFWLIREDSNMKKPEFLQSLHRILKTKICFDASHDVPSCRKLYSCNHCICRLKTKFVLIHQRRFQHVENSILAITAIKFFFRMGWPWQKAMAEGMAIGFGCVCCLLLLFVQIFLQNFFFVGIGAQWVYSNEVQSWAHSSY